MKKLIPAIMVFTAISRAAVSAPQATEEYLMPSDAVTVLRGPLSFCRADRVQNGVRPFAYIQFGQSKCLGPLSTTRIGKDRPENEVTSPGIPFKDRGLE